MIDDPNYSHCEHGDCNKKGKISDTYVPFWLVYVLVYSSGFIHALILTDAIF